MSMRYSEAETAALLSMPRPDVKALDLQGDALISYHNREAALEAVLNGASINQTSKRFNLLRSVIDRMVKLAGEPALGGGLNGFRVCLEGIRLVMPRPSVMTLPPIGGAMAWTRTLGAVPKVRELVHNFKGALPERNIRSPSFNRLHRDVITALQTLGHQAEYPLNTSDQGRRALRLYIERQRQILLEGAMADLPDHPDITRLEHLFDLKPMDRVEVDAHWIDLKEGYVAVLRPDGTYALAQYSGLWFMAMIDVASRAIVAWILVPGRSYDRTDLLELLSKALTPWERRDLLGEKVSYLANAWMPSCCFEDGLMARPLITALDNARAHTAKQTRANMLDFQLGVYHFGPSGIPEVRGYIEAFFKLIEDVVFRFIAGGFEPETPSRPEQAVAPQRPKDHPIIMEALEDLVDTAITAYNVAPHTGIQKRSPREFFQSYLASGALVLRSTRTLRDKTDLLTFRIQVTFRGKKGSVLPHVNFMGSRYRSPKTNGQWHLIRKSFAAVIDLQDVRTLTLLDDKGVPFVTLHALPPYARTAHTYKQRKRAEQLRKATGERWEGVEDMITHYHAYVRNMAKQIRWAADEVVAGRAPPSKNAATPPPISAHNLKGLPALNGPVRLR